MGRLESAAGARLRTQLSSLSSLLSGVSRDALDQRVAGKWSATENLAHLARYHQVFAERMRAILEEHEPILRPYRAEDDAAWPAWQSQSFDQILDHLHTARARLITALNSLTPEQWERTGTHMRFGRLSLRAWLDLFLVHEGHHLYIIAKRAHGLE